MAERYCRERNDHIEQIDCKTDLIGYEPLITQYKDGCIGLEAEGVLHYWDSENLKRWVIRNQTHPLTRRVLTDEQLQYILHKATVFEQEKRHYFTETEIKEAIKDLFKSENLMDLKKDVIRNNLTIYHLVDHFKEYEESDITYSTLQYERQQAEKELTRKGKWLFRKSSYNRRTEKEQEILNRLNIVFYAFSFVDEHGKKAHRLIVHRPGYGWGISVNGMVQFTEKSLSNRGFVYSVCFADILFSLLYNNKLSFVDIVNRYL